MLIVVDRFHSSTFYLFKKLHFFYEMFFKISACICIVHLHTQNYLFCFLVFISTVIFLLHFYTCVCLIISHSSICKFPLHPLLFFSSLYALFKKSINRCFYITTLISFFYIIIKLLSVVNAHSLNALIC